MSASTETRVTPDAIAGQVFALLQAGERDLFPSVADLVYERIWRQLVIGALQPGAHLSEAGLATEFGVSRTPIREALQRLVQEGFAQATPRRGFRVGSFAAEDVDELFDIRANLESLALVKAAQHLRADDLRGQLEEIRLLRERGADQSIVAFLKHDFQLHNLFIRASQSPRLIRILAATRGQISFFQIRDTYFPGRIDHALAGHEQILHLLLDDRFDEASHRLADHIADSKTSVLKDMFGNAAQSAETSYEAVFPSADMLERNEQRD